MTKSILDHTLMLICGGCQQNLEKYTYIKDTVTNTFYCLPCFTKCNQKTGKNGSNPYQIVDSLEKKIFCRDYEGNQENQEEWSLREELILLEGLQHCGFGNWTDIAGKVGSKTKEQCEQHYLKFWWRHRKSLNTIKESIEDYKESNFSQFNVKKLTEKLSKILESKESDQEAELIKIGLTRSKIEKFRSKIQSNPKTAKKASLEGKEEEPQSQYLDVFGFYPLRRDFDIEHDCDAENYIADMEFEGSFSFI